MIGLGPIGPPHFSNFLTIFTILSHFTYSYKHKFNSNNKHNKALIQILKAIKILVVNSIFSPEAEIMVDLSSTCGTGQYTPSFQEYNPSNYQLSVAI